MKSAIQNIILFSLFIVACILILILERPNKEYLALQEQINIFHYEKAKSAAKKALLISKKHLSKKRYNQYEAKYNHFASSVRTSDAYKLSNLIARLTFFETQYFIQLKYRKNYLSFSANEIQRKIWNETPKQALVSILRKLRKIENLSFMDTKEYPVSKKGIAKLKAAFKKAKTNFEKLF